MSQQNRDDEADIMREVRGLLVALGIGVAFLTAIAFGFRIGQWLWPLIWP